MAQRAVYTVSRLTLKDVDGLAAALDSVARENRFFTFSTAPPLPEIRRFVRRNLKAGNPHVVAKDGAGALVGWCDIVRHSAPVKSHCGTLGIGVVRAFRRAGVGTCLLRAAIKDARAAGITRIELSVRKRNAAAIRMYGKAGFAIEGVQRKALRIDGRYVDTVTMALVLPT